MRPSLTWIVACLLAGCAPELASTADTPIEELGSPVRIEDPRIIPIPDIPAPLRGCWMLDDSDYPHWPHRLIVTATRLVQDGREAKADYVNRISADWIDGRFAASDGATVATELELSDGEDGVEAGKLILREGDAGSYHYSRCRP